MDRLVIPAFYLFWVLFALWLTRASKQKMLQRLAWLCLVNWAIHNVIIETLGAAWAPMLLPAKDAVLAISVPFIAGRSGVAAGVFGLFVALGIVHVDAFLTHTQGRYSYLLTCNLIFLAQVVLVGGAGGLAQLLNRARTGDLGARWYLGHARVDAAKREGGA